MIKKIIIISVCFGLILPFVSGAISAPAVQFYANGSSTSPVNISYNYSVNLTWSSSNADYCQASGDWSGTKSVAGAETIYSITSNKDFKITCYNPSGFTIAEIVVVVTSVPTSFQVTKLVKNVSQGTAYLDAVSAKPGERISFRIQITAGSTGSQAIFVKDTLPSQMSYLGNLTIDNISYSGNITSGFNLGDISSNQTKIITFDASVANANQFYQGTTNLTNTVLVYNTLFSTSDTARVLVYKATGGGPTTVPTGLTNNFFLDSFFLPLIIAFLIIWLFKSHIINFEKWADSKKNEYRSYKARKTLDEIRAKELSREKKQK